MKSIRRNQSQCFVRLACVKHAASVHPEPGSNSHLKICAYPCLDYSFDSLENFCLHQASPDANFLGIFGVNRVYCLFVKVLFRLPLSATAIKDYHNRNRLSRVILKIFFGSGNNIISHFPQKIYKYFLIILLFFVCFCDSPI